MFIGTRRRKNIRKGIKYLRQPLADQNGPRVKPGVTREEGETDRGDAGVPGSGCTPGVAGRIEQ
jgi:hypothetical protein